MKRSIATAGALLLLSATAGQAQQQLSVGSPDVDGRLILAGTYTTQLTVYENGERTPASLQKETIALVTHNGKEQLRQITTMQRNGDVQSTDTTYFDPETLAPTQHRSSNSWSGQVSLNYWGNHVAGTKTTADGTTEDVRLTLDQPLYDVSGVMLVVRALPLQEGYGANIPVLNRRDLSTQLVSVWVHGIESMRSGGEQMYVVSISRWARTG